MKGPNIQLVSESPRVKRGTRSPQHPFNIRTQPWQIAPFMIAPVLPGETMKNLMLMARTASDPVKNKLMGWWCEYYFFYVKHRDLEIRDNLVAMHLDQSYDITGQFSAADPITYHNGGLNFVRKCLETVTKWYFRDHDEGEPTAINGLPVSKVNAEGWWQSYRVGDPSTDDFLDGPGDELPSVDAGDDYALSPYQATHKAQFAQWRNMVNAGITTVSFEDYLASFGVRAPQQVDEEIHRPELLRYVREFTYPTNTIDPATGTPSSAVVWSTSERADKDRFFSEPGYVFGVQVCRPKVMLSAITGTITSYMNYAFDFLPALIQDQAYASIKRFPSGGGPSPVAAHHWVDLRDLFLYGEQFRNHGDQVNSVALPRASGDHKYPTAAEAQALFIDVDAHYLRTDGLVSLSVASPIFQDTST